MPSTASASTDSSTSASAGRATYLVRFALLTATYFAAGKLGLALAFVNESASAVWPPAGIAVGALLAYGLRIWPAIAISAFFVNLTTSGLPVPSLAIAAGNTLEAVAGSWLIAAWAGGAAAFERTARIFRFSLLACTVVPVIAATIGTSTLLAAGLATRTDFVSVWVTWWLGDAVGILLFTPLFVLWARRPSPPSSLRRWIETGLVMASVGLTAWVIFGNSPAGARNYPLQILVAPVLLWPAFRLGARETATATALLAVLAVGGTIRGLGPFVRSSPNESLLLLQSFVGTIAVLMLSVAAEVATRVRLEASARALNETLERRVEVRTDELSRMHDRMAEAQRVAHVGSWEWDVGSDNVWWSEELYRIYAVAPGTPMSYETFIQLVHHDDRPLVEQAVRLALTNREPFSFEHRVIRPDGTEGILQAHGHVVFDATGNPIRMVGTAHDITDRRRAEDERAQLAREQAARREAENANRAKDEFLAILSHELRTPLNAALGWAQMLRSGIADPERGGRALDAILRNLGAQARLVSDMLDTSHILLGTMRLERTVVDLATVAREAVEMILESAAARRLEVEVHLPNTPARVIGDTGRLQQVVWNLLSNAAKFSREGSSITVSVRSEGDTVLLAVEDNGPGIAPDFLPHIFERFRQADSSLTRQHGGLGLGLAIARHLVEAHGGTIAAANRSGGGAVFTVRLPAATNATAL